MERDPNQTERSSGILLHISSLPSPYGIGSFGEAARRWVDFLAEAKQSYWQILPLSPGGLGNSPYSSCSAFAGNPYFIDLDILCEEGLLKRAEYANINWGRSESRVDYCAIFRHRERILRKAFARFKDEAALDDFAAQNPWLEHYSQYLAIKDAHSQQAWIQWDEPLRLRQPDAISEMKTRLANDIRYYTFVQYQFKRQWLALREYANAKKVEIIGDIPIYVSSDSADVWANRDLFLLNAAGFPTEVSGCPPDPYSSDGQLWGNPLYDWKKMAKTDYAWWMYRLRYSFELYDVLRIDHFRGLESYYAIPYGAPTAAVGKWKRGPGKGFIKTIRRALPNARIIAEDLGYLTPKVRELLAYSGYPGMKLVQFAFDSRVTGEYRPFTYGAHSVVYPGTHDNETIKGWCNTASRGSVRKAMDYIGIRSESDLPLAMLRLTLQTAANLSVIPMQDWLQLGSGARMNIPSTIGGLNWRWRLREGALTERLAASIARVTSIYGRIPGEESVTDELDALNNNNNIVVEALQKE